ncbi:MAG: family 10 glycosylhydrolase [Sedimentisphaerales bacterium]|nr:family 10 glycosylhydrolase [Sedimentisphaerales bacterium]
MKKAFLITLILALSTMTALAAKRKAGKAGGWPELQAEEKSRTATGKVTEKLMLVSWGDLMYFYGPETDPGLMTRTQIANMMKYWKEQGFTQIYWRGEKILSEFVNRKWNNSTIYAEGSALKKEAEIIFEKYGVDTTEIAIEEAHKLGLKLYFWHSVFDDGTPADKIHRKWAQGFPWRITFFDEHPELETRDRQGKVQWGVRDLAYPLSRSQKIDQYVKILQKYPELDGVFIYLHSHSDPGDNGDQYGFNKPIVDEYKKRYDIDILTDPRFDWKNPDFDPKDEVVEKWRVLRGEYMTKFLREIKTALKKVRPDIKIAINTQGGDYWGPPFSNLKTDWRTWINEGLIDLLIVRTWMAGGCGAYDFSKEGYLTWGDGNIGVTPYSEIRKTIDESGNDVKLISRARTYIEDVDGYYDSTNRDSTYPKNQRKRQLESNIKTFGYIGFIQQDFENCRPLEEKGLLDFTTGKKRYAIGNCRYLASKNTTPGLASFFTEDKTVSPALIDAEANPVVYGTVVYMDKSSVPFGIHRRTGTSWPDEKIDTGKVKMSLDIYRKPGSSFLVKCRGENENPAVMFDSKGQLQLMKEGKWTASGLFIKENVWTKLFIELDFKAGRYIVVTGNNFNDFASSSFDREKTALDGLFIKCNEGAFCFDNINMIWSW